VRAKGFEPQVVNFEREGICTTYLEMSPEVDRLGI
jgi:hypothetical protein